LYFVSNLINSTCINFKRSIRCILCQYWVHLHNVERAESTKR
jgi:hypothetical protein